MGFIGMVISPGFQGGSVEHVRTSVRAFLTPPNSARSTHEVHSRHQKDLAEARVVAPVGSRLHGERKNGGVPGWLWAFKNYAHRIGLDVWICRSSPRLSGGA